MTEVEVLTGCAKCDIVYIPIISIIKINHPFEFKLLHSTVKLWFAIAINKVQTLKLADIDIPASLMTNFTLYVLKLAWNIIYIFCIESKNEHYNALRSIVDIVLYIPKNNRSH